MDLTFWSTAHLLTAGSVYTSTHHPLEIGDLLNWYDAYLHVFIEWARKKCVKWRAGSRVRDVHVQMPWDEEAQGLLGEAQDDGGWGKEHEKEACVGSDDMVGFVQAEM